MLIWEVADFTDTTVQQIAALVQFLSRRAKESGVNGSIELSRFLELVNGLGLSVTSTTLRNMIQKPPLSNLIQDIQGDDKTGKVIFKDEDDEADTMSVDQARETVNAMAKKAASPAFK